MISVLLVDDHAIFLETLRFLLTKASDVQVVATALNGEEAIIQAQLYCPDVVVMDISMPVMDGIEATKQTYVHCPSTRVLVLSIYDNQEYVQRALQVGALGYVLKDMVGSDLLAAIRALYAGNQYFSEKIAGIAQQYGRQRGNESLPS
ncbi:MAG TPA: response regulator transcription factor [Anaerolineales bacterium]|nr:response regulator transcription factor [Anaerolineales bacterium]